MDTMAGLRVGATSPKRRDGRTSMQVMSNPAYNKVNAPQNRRAGRQRPRMTPLSTERKPSIPQATLCVKVRYAQPARGAEGRCRKAQAERQAGDGSGKSSLLSYHSIRETSDD